MFISSWHWQREEPLSPIIILSSLISLTKHLNPMSRQNLLGEIRSKFSDLKWFPLERAEFCEIVKIRVTKFLHDYLADGQIAMENFITLLSRLFNLRFKIQDALFRLFQRSQD